MKNNGCIITELADGEFNGIDIFEINEIPDISILIRESSEEKDFSQRHKKEFETMLTEFFFGCKQDFTSQYQNQDYSIELIFKSEEVKNQTYKANVKIYIILRGISREKEYLKSRLQELKNAIKSVLAINKYTLSEIENKENILNEIKEIECKEKRVITKDYRMENIQSAYLPQCFTFDKLPIQDCNFTKIISTLMQYPDSAIIIDLIPTLFSQNEISNMEQYSSTLDIISKGVPGPEGAPPNILAEKPSAIYQYYESNKYGVLFAYNILICSDFNNINNITNRVSGELSIGGSKEKREYAKLKKLEIGNYELDVKEYFSSLPWVINEIIMDKNMENPVFTSSQLGRLPFIVTSEEASEFFRIPYGDNDLAHGVKIRKEDKGERK